MRHSYLLLPLLLFGCVTDEWQGTCDDWTEPAVTGGCPSGGPTASGEATRTDALSEGLSVVRNLTYGTRGGLALQGDLFLPPAGGAGPPGVLVMVHGGGWQDCERRRGAIDRVAELFARLGDFGVFNVEYRLRQEGGGYPGNLGDVRCAVQWMAANAGAHGLDGSRLAIIGESAGGHLALMAALTEERADLDPACGPAVSLAAAVAFSAPTDLPRIHQGSTLAKGAPGPYAGPCGGASVDGCEAGRACARCVDASPLAHACAAQAPFVLVQAPDAFDPLIPLEQAALMHQALQEAGRTSILAVPSEEELVAQGCAPGSLPQSAHGFTICLIGPTGPAVFGVLGTAIGRF